MNISSNKTHYLLVTLIYISLWFYMVPFGLEPGDPSVKYLQVIDFINQNYSSISCIYQGIDIDPDMKYIPLKDSFFLHIINNKCYYVFPFYFTFILIPFYFIGGLKFTYLVPLLCGLYTIWLFVIWSDKVITSNKNKILFLYSIAISGVSIFSISLSEMNVNLALLSTSFYLVWKSFESKNNNYFFLAIFITGTAVYLRQESLPFGFLLIAFSFLFKRINLKISLISSAIYIVLILNWFLINYQLFGNIMGLRGFQQIHELSKNSFLRDRAMMVLEVFFYGRDNVGLLLAYPLLCLIPFKLKNKFPILPENLKPLILSVLSFVIILPLSTITYQGVFWGTRFLLSTVPFLIFVSFLLYEILGSSKFWIKIIYFSIIWSFIGLSINFAIGKYAFNKTKLVNDYIDKHSRDTIVLYGGFLESTIISSYQKRKIFSITDNKDITGVLKLLKENNIEKFSIIYATEYFAKENNLFTEELSSLFDEDEKFISDEIRIKNVRLKEAPKNP